MCFKTTYLKGTIFVPLDWLCFDLFFYVLTLFFCCTNCVTRFPHSLNFDPNCTQIHEALKTLCKAFCLPAYMPFKSQGFVGRCLDSKHQDVSWPSPKHTEKHTHTQSSTHAHKSQPQWRCTAVVCVVWIDETLMSLFTYSGHSPIACGYWYFQPHIRRLKKIIIMVYILFKWLSISKWGLSWNKYFWFALNLRLIL